MKSLFLLLVIPVVLFADDIHLTDSRVIKNVMIISDNSTSIVVEGNGLKTGVLKSIISRIETAPFNENEPSKIIGTAKPMSEENKISLSEINSQLLISKTANKEVVISSRRNLPLLALSAVSFALAYDYFKESSDIGKNIDLLKKIPNTDTSEMESAKTRKTVIGAVILAAGLVNTVYALLPVNISVSPNQVGISYQYNLN